MAARNSHPELSTIQTDDGWSLAAHHYPNTKANYPVILLHGLGTNRFNVDFVDPRLSLAKYLHRHGFDVWIIELRGSGKSQPVTRWHRWRSYVRPTWTFDDHVFGDIPNFVKHIRKVTGKRSFHWVGHSLGGNLIYAAVGTMGNSICKSAVTVASAMNSKAKPGFTKLLVKIEDRILRMVPLIPSKYMASLGYQAFGVIAPLLNNFYFCLDNIEQSTLKRAGRIAIENMSVPLFLQMHRWYKNDVFVSLDKSVNYHEHLKRIRAPWFAIAGSVDGLTPLPDVYFGYDEIRSRKKKFMVFGKEFGHKTDYGHFDLLLGKNAPNEVYPEVLQWLRAHDR